MIPENEHAESVRKVLKSAFPALDCELHRDLWPAMLNRMTAAPIRLPWFDWVLLALSSRWPLEVPQGILQLFN